MKYLYTLVLLVYSLFLYGQDETNDKIFFKKFNGDNFNITVNDIAIDDDNRIIVASDKLLFSILGQNNNHTTLWDKASFSAVCVGDNKHVYAGGENHLYIVSKEEKIKLPKTCRITDMAQQGDYVWIGSNNGVFRYDLRNQAWKSFTKNNSKLLSNKINFVSIDDKDILWIGTEAGYVRVKGDKWKAEDKRENVLTSRANKEGQWMVSDGDMWLIDPYNRKYVVGLEDNMHAGKVNDFVIDSKDRIYMASNVLVRYDPYEEKIEQFGEGAGILSQKCLSLAVDKNDKIWLGTENDGLYYISFDLEEVTELTASLLVRDNVSCHNNADGSIYLSVAGGTTPYTLEWEDTESTEMERSGLQAGTYTVTITDADNQSTTQSITLTNPEEIRIEIVDQQSISEAGRRDGYIKTSATGGSGRLSYKWDHGPKKNNLSGLGKGTYTLTVKDNAGCTARKAVYIGDSKNIPELTSGDVSVGKVLTINNLNFQADSTNVNPSNFVILDEVVDFLQKYNTVTIEIGGHTNTIPPHEYCDRLSESRAKSVAEYLTYKGIKSNRVSYKGYGKRKPLIKSRSLKARKKNQRVEIKILTI